MVLLEDELGEGGYRVTFTILYISQKGEIKITIIVRLLELQRSVPTSAPREKQPATGPRYLVSLNATAE